MNTSEKDFEAYSNRCLSEMSSLQDEFMQLYDINSYEEWYYDHDIGAFHFKADDGRNLYFKYVDVGSFSTKANTWNWSWDNQSTPRHVKRQLEKVRAYGMVSNYSQLTTGLFNGDEYTGWEMTAVAAKLLSAMGMYRIPQEHLFIYFIFIDEFTPEQYDELKDKYVACDAHSSGRTAFVCRHLIDNEYPGFNEAFESDVSIEEDDDYQAWCDECEKIRAREGEWNDESMAFADIKVVCDECYFEIKKRNQTE
jgi:hypothetical protein